MHCWLTNAMADRFLPAAVARQETLGTVRIVVSKSRETESKTIKCAARKQRISFWEQENFKPKSDERQLRSQADSL